MAYPPPVPIQDESPPGRTDLLPRSLVVEDASGERVDLSAGMPLPHVYTFAGLYQTAWKVYYMERFDEAMRHHRANALAMALDEHLNACLWERVRETTRLAWHLEVDDDRDPHQRAARDGITKLVKRTPRLRRYIRWLLWNALWCGRSANQMAWGKCEVEVEGLPTHQGLYCKKHKPVDGDKIGYQFDDTPVVLVNGGSVDDIPDATSTYTTESRAVKLAGTWRNRFVIHQVNCMDVNFWEGDRADAVHGVGIRHFLYWSWWNKNEFMAAVIKSLDKVGLGLVVIEYDQSNPQAQAQATAMGKNLSVDRSVITLPVPKDRMGGGGPVKVVNTPVAGAQVMLELQAACERREERFIIAQSGSASTGSAGMGTHDMSFVMATKAALIEEDAGEVAETLTGSAEEPGLVSEIQRYTYPWADFPVRWVFEVNKPNPEQILGAVTMAFNMGCDFDKDEVRKVTSMSKPSPDAETLVNPAFQQAMQGAAVGPDGQPMPGGPPGQPGQPGGGPGELSPNPPEGPEGADDDLDEGDPIFRQAMQRGGGGAMAPGGGGAAAALLAQLGEARR